MNNQISHDLLYKNGVFSNFQLWLPVISQPLKVQEGVGPFWKPLMSLSYELDVQGYGITFRVCHAFLKNAILLSISLVGYVIISAPLYNQRKGPLLLLSFLSDAFPILANIWIIRILKYYSRQQNKHFGDSWSYLFQVLNLTKKGTEYDIEGGTKPRSNKKERSINQKCSEFILKVFLTSIVMAVFIAYFVAISRSSNPIGNFQEFDVANVTNSPLLGSFFVSICI